MMRLSKTGAPVTVFSVLLLLASFLSLLNFVSCLSLLKAPSLSDNTIPSPRTSSCHRCRRHRILSHRQQSVVFLDQDNGDANGYIREVKQAQQDDSWPSPGESRRRMLQRSLTSVLVGGALTLTSPVPASLAADDVLVSNDNETGKPVFKTESGLKYIDLEKGKPNGVSPRYGQLVVFSYTGYLQLPKNPGQRQKFATSSGYVTKHGNGKLIAGLDEGLHTMNVGGLRRVIIPPKLGFVESGLGPLPEYPWQRWKLNGLLEDMVTQRGGNLVYDVRLERVLDDEADQGYYEDLEITPEERAELESRLNKGRGGGGGGGGGGTTSDIINLPKEGKNII